MNSININLLGVERKEALKKKGSLPIDKGWLTCIGIIVGALLISLLANFFYDTQVASAEETKASNETEIKKLDAQLKEIKELEGKKNQAEMEEKILLHVTGDTYRWSYLLQEIRTLMPLDLIINDLKISGSGSFTLNGTTTDHSTVALYLTSLKSSQMLTDVQLKSSTKSGESTSFIITCKVKSE